MKLWKRISVIQMPLVFMLRNIPWIRYASEITEIYELLTLVCVCLCVWTHTHKLRQKDGAKLKSERE